MSNTRVALVSIALLLTAKNANHNLVIYGDEIGFQSDFQTPWDID